MGAFTLDTSGAVQFVTLPNGSQALAVTWGHLDPFTQGYVEALFAWWSAELLAEQTKVVGLVEDEFRPRIRLHSLGFRHLSPSALERIVRDCGEHRKIYRAAYNDSRNPKRGGWFWKNRQAGMWTREGFPPLTVSLDDAGKVTLAERVRA